MVMWLLFLGMKQKVEEMEKRDREEIYREFLVGLNLDDKVKIGRKVREVGQPFNSND